MVIFCMTTRDDFMATLNSCKQMNSKVGGKENWKCIQLQKSHLDEIHSRENV